MRRLTQEEAEERVQKRCDEMNYELIEPFVYKNQKTRVKLKCLKDGYEWTPMHYNFIQNRNCPKCGGSLKRTQKEAEEIVHKKCIEKNYEVIEPFIYINKNTRLKIRCLSDKYKWESSFHDFTYGDYGCTRCTNSEKITQENAEQIVENYCRKYNYQLDKPFIYKNNKMKIFLKCNNDNHKWTNVFVNIKFNISACPYCNLSKGEIKTKEILKYFNIKFETQKKFKECKDKRLLPFDFYLPDLNICVEYDGKQHFEIIENWGGEKGLIDRQKKDNIKDKYCKDNGIKLIRIRYDENIEEKLKENHIII